MRRVVVGLVLFVALVALGIWAGSVQAATQGSWVPGTNYLVSEDDAVSFLEKRMDYAYCRGISRFGHRGEFPDEEFVVFDCTVEWEGTRCTDARMKAIKGTKRGYYRMIVQRRDLWRCY